MQVEENKLFLDDDFSPEDDNLELSLDDTSPEELDQLWDDADDEFEVCASKKMCDRKRCVIGALIAAAVVAFAGYFIYRCLKASRGGERPE